MSGTSNTWKDSLNKRILIDNGAYMIKCSLVTEAKPHTCFNGVAKDRKTRQIYIGSKDDFFEKTPPMNLQITHPIIRGLLHDSDVETVIWKQMFQKFYKKMEERVSCLCITVPPILPELVENRIAEVAFEDFEFDALMMASSHSMIRENAIAEHALDINPLCQFVVDSGYSFTYGVPFFNGYPLKYAATRIDVGGKLLTNLLSEIISYREVNMQGEVFLVNEIKESLCYVTNRINEDMDVCNQMLLPNQSNPIIKEYVLPDYKTILKGYVKGDQEEQQQKPEKRVDEESKQESTQINTSKKAKQVAEQQQNEVQSVRLGIERFTVPEVLFNPSDIGINEAGIPEMVQQSIGKCPKSFENLLYQNMIIAGGNTMFKGFKERLENEMEKLKPCETSVKIYDSQNPLQAAWKGMKQFCSNKTGFEEYVVTRKEYQEEGYRILKKFYL